MLVIIGIYLGGRVCVYRAIIPAVAPATTTCNFEPYIFQDTLLSQVKLCPACDGAKSKWLDLDMQVAKVAGRGVQARARYLIFQTLCVGG